MGTWGVYDDENDYVADLWIQILDSILPKAFKEVESYLEEDYDTVWKLRNAYAKNNMSKLYDSLVKWIAKFKKNDMKNFEEGENPYQYIVGIVLKAIRYVEELPASDPLSTGIFNSLIPTKLPSGFPETLRKEVLKAVKSEIGLNQLGWKNQKERDNALQYELFLFSKGKEGMEGKHPRSMRKKSKETADLPKKTYVKKARNKSRRNSKKTSKKTSKRTSRDTKKGRANSRENSRATSRKGPNMSATSSKVGTVKKGNDGNLWVVKDYSTKYGAVQRWIRK